MEELILAQMRKNSEKKQITPTISPKIVPVRRPTTEKTLEKTLEKPKEHIREDSREDAVLNRYLNLPIKIEIEVSFGEFIDKKFVPGVSIFQFNNLLAKLTNFANENRWWFGKKHTVEEIDSGLKKITSDDDTVWQKKTRNREDTVDNHKWGYRINKSEETFTDEAPPNFKPSVTREKYRTTFLANENSQGFSNIKFDLTKVIEVIKGKSITKYEVEIERIERATPVKDFKNAINFVLGSMQRNLDTPKNIIDTTERKNAILAHNSLFGKNMGLNLFSNYWNKPKNLKIFDLMNPKNKYSVTLKIDGIRIFILITGVGMYACIPPFNIWKIGPGMPKLNGTLLDSEMYTTEDNTEDNTVTYFAFDCLFSKGKDMRENRFVERLEETTEICKKTAMKVKKFYTSRDLYKNVEDALKEATENKYDLNFDGIIFQPSTNYKNNYTRKWKPESSLTIDFKLSNTIQRSGKITNLSPNEFSLLVGTDKGILESFAPEDNPLTIIIPDETLEIENSNNTMVNVHANGLIMECKWDNGSFTPIKYRDDKEEPNFITTANDVWQDIKNPVTKETIRGRTLLTMRKYHNMIKKAMLESNFKKGDVINDWGSGRGGDIDKWMKLGLKKVYGIEPNVENIEELRRRAREAGWEHGIKILSKYESLTGKVYIGAEETHHVVENIDEKVDGIVSFFSLTFFGASAKTFDGMISTIDSLLLPSKKFIGIVMDGDRVEKLLGGASKYEDAAFSIEKISDFSPDIVEGKNEIRVEIKEASSMVKYNEWLFHFDLLVNALKKIGIELKTTGFLDGKSKDFDAEVFKILPEPGKVFSSLNRYFVFERVTGKQKKIRKPTIDFDFGQDFGQLVNDPGAFKINMPTVNKKTSFIESVMCAIDKKCGLLATGERERRVKVLKKRMSEILDVKGFYEKLNRKEKIKDFKIMLINEELPVTVYTDILSRLLEVNILVITDRGKYIKFDSDRKIFGCYENTIIIYGRKGLYGYVADKDGVCCFKTKSTFIKEILKLIVKNKKYNKVT